MRACLRRMGCRGAAALMTLVIGAGCSSVVPDQNPVGERFPSVTGKSLEGEEVTVPDAYLGRPMLYLVGYEQDAQFDLDRWIFGMLQSGTTLGLRELPTIPGFVPRLFAETIDGGMRKGIPQADWGAVITLYEDGAVVENFLGSERRTNAYAVLVDAQGRVQRVHAEGYSAQVLLDYLAVYAAMNAGSGS